MPAQPGFKGEPGAKCVSAAAAEGVLRQLMPDLAALRFQHLMRIVQNDFLRELEPADGFVSMSIKKQKKCLCVVVYGFVLPYFLPLTYHSLARGLQSDLSFQNLAFRRTLPCLHSLLREEIEPVLASTSVANFTSLSQTPDSRG